MATTYEQDLSAWAREQARLMRERRFEALDIEHLAEEIEDMSRSDRRELTSRLTILLQHLLKWTFQPERRSASWQATILAQRDELADLFEQSPSLRSEWLAMLPKCYARAARRAQLETGMASFPSECPFSPQDLLNEDFWPN